MSRYSPKLAAAVTARRAAAQTAVACPTGKLPYPSRDHAGKALTARRRRSSADDDQLTTYHCRHCSKWHLGHDDIGRPP